MTDTGAAARVRRRILPARGGWPRSRCGEALIGDNLDIGRPENIETIFGRKILPDKARAIYRRMLSL